MKKSLIIIKIIFLIFFYIHILNSRTCAYQSVDQAIEWALQQKQSPTEPWLNKCLHFVGNAFGYDPAGYYSAWDAWLSPNYPSGKFGPQNPAGTFIPHGALVFFDMVVSGERLGHVGIYLYNGNIIHAGIHNYVEITPISSINGYVGWRWPTSWTPDPQSPPAAPLQWSLVNQEGDSKVYLFGNGKKWWVQDNIYFTTLGFKWEYLHTYPAGSLNQYPDGPIIPSENLLVTLTPDYYLLQGNQWHYIPDPDFNKYLSCRGGYDPQNVLPITSDFLALYAIGSALTPCTPPASITLSTASLAPSCQQGLNASSQSFEVWNSGGGTLSYSINDNANWLSVNPAIGTSTGEHDTITVNYTSSGLATGTYQATITVSDPNANNTPQTISVTLTVIPNPVPPVIALSTTSMTPSCQQGQNAASQTFQVWNSGGGTLSYSINDDVNWLSVSPGAGTSMGEHDIITVNYLTSGLVAGKHNASVTVSDPNASNSPSLIAVYLTVNPGPIMAILTDKTTVNVPKGGTAVFGVKLSSQPLTNTVVSVFKLSGVPEISVLEGNSLTFTPANWDTYQSVKLAATADNHSLNGTATFQLNATGCSSVNVTAKKIGANITAILHLLLLD